MPLQRMYLPVHIFANFSAINDLPVSVKSWEKRILRNNLPPRWDFLEYTFLPEFTLKIMLLLFLCLNT